MLPAFVIGLREGVEASLIVGIVALFLRQNGRADAVRWVYTGVALAVAICLAGGIALHALERTLPQKQRSYRAEQRVNEESRPVWVLSSTPIKR